MSRIRNEPQRRSFVVRSTIRPFVGTDRQNSFRSSWLWNRSSEFASIELALEPIVRIRFDRAYFGTDRQNLFRSSWLWNRSSGFQILILPRLGPPPSDRTAVRPGPSLGKIKICKTNERTTNQRTNERTPLCWDSKLSMGRSIVPIPNSTWTGRFLYGAIGQADCALPPGLGPTVPCHWV